MAERWIIFVHMCTKYDVEDPNEKLLDLLRNLEDCSTSWLLTKVLINVQSEPHDLPHSDHNFGSVPPD